MESVFLVGAEDVRSAGSAIKSAAELMIQASANMDEAMRMHARTMEDLVTRFETAVESLKSSNVKQEE